MQAVWLTQFLDLGAPAALSVTWTSSQSLFFSASRFTDLLEDLERDIGRVEVHLISESGYLKVNSSLEYCCSVEVPVWKIYTVDISDAY